MFNARYPLAFHETRLEILMGRTISPHSDIWGDVFPQIRTCKGHTRTKFIKEALDLLRIPFGTIPTRINRCDDIYVHPVKTIGVVQQNVDRLDRAGEAII